MRASPEISTGIPLLTTPTEFPRDARREFGILKNLCRSVRQYCDFHIRRQPSLHMIVCAQRQNIFANIFRHSDFFRGLKIAAAQPDCCLFRRGDCGGQEIFQKFCESPCSAANAVKTKIRLQNTEAVGY
jgi:hypothetical protein